MSHVNTRRRAFSYNRLRAAQISFHMLLPGKQASAKTQHSKFVREQYSLKDAVIPGSRCAGKNQMCPPNHQRESKNFPLRGASDCPLSTDIACIWPHATATQIVLAVIKGRNTLHAIISSQACSMCMERLCVMRTWSSNADGCCLTCSTSRKGAMPLLLNPAGMLLPRRQCFVQHLLYSWRRQIHGRQ